MRRTAYIGLASLLLVGALAIPGEAQQINDGVEYGAYLAVLNEKDLTKKSALARFSRTLSALVFLLLAVPAAAQWSAVGTLPRPEPTSDGLVYRGGAVALSVTSVTPEVVRVRLARGKTFGRDHSYAVLPRQGSAPRVTVQAGAAESSIQTDALRVIVKHQPFLIEVVSRDGTSLDADDPTYATAYAGSTIRTWKRLRDDEQVFGFGEKNGRLNKRGKKRSAKKAGPTSK